MTKILELREKRAKAWKAAKAFLDTKRGNDGLLSAEDTTAYEKMEADVVALGREIERLERQAAIDAELNAPTSNAITNVPQRPGEDNKIGRARDEYRRDFFAAMRGRTVTNVLSEGVDADGGYLVPTEFERTIVQGLDEDNVIRKLAKTITTSVERKVPIAATPSVATWVAENGAIPESGVTFDQKTLDAYKLTDLVKVSVELLADSMFDLESYLAAEFARAMGVAEEEAFCVGNGTGRPSGIFTENGGHVGATSSGASITFDDVINLVYSLKTP